MKNLLSILKMDFVKINQIGKNLRSFSCFVCCLILVFGSSFQSLAVTSSSSNAFAVNPNYLIGSASNADPYGVATLELSDEDYFIQPFSTLGTVSNTVSASRIPIAIRYYDSNEVVHSIYAYATLNNGRYSFNYILPSGSYIDFFEIQLRKADGALPNPGNYRLSFDFASDFSYDYRSTPYFYYSQVFNNAAPINGNVRPPIDSFSGDIYMSPYNISLGSLNSLYLVCQVKIDQSVSALGGSFAIRFEKTSDSGLEIGTSFTSEDYDTGVSDSLSDISSSIGDMSESLDSAAENLEYISTSQNLIIQGIDNVIMHISDQLYAFWDQLYNLIHEPTYARLGDILDALKAIANNSDIYAVVETIEESSEKQTADIIANNNANTTKVESAVEKHGNFIIDGLKGLFIPSDEYFKTYFDDLYSYFSDRFGFLSFPIDLLVRLIDLFANSSDRDCILTLPSFEISGEQLISEASFNLTEFLENDFSLVLSSIRLVTSIGLIMAFVNLCQDKWNEVMRN